MIQKQILRKVSICALIALFSIQDINGQNVGFQNNWKKDETKVFITEIIKQQFFNGEKFDQEETELRQELKVVDVSKKHYDLLLTTENIIFDNIKSLQPNIVGFFPSYQHLHFHLKYDRLNQKIDLFDWAMHRDTIHFLMDSIFEIIKIQNPDNYLQSFEIVEGLRFELTDSARIINYIHSLIPQVLIPFRTKFGLKDAIKTTFKVVNPFTGDDFVDVEASHYVSFRNKRRKQYELKVSERYDLNDYLTDKVKAAQKIIQAMQPDSDSEDIATLAKKVNSEFSHVYTIIMKKNESWPKFVTQNTIILNADWKQEIKVIIQKKTYIK